MSTPEQLRDAGIALREHHADPRLIAIVDTKIEQFAASAREFSANELRKVLPDSAQPLIGGRLTSARNRGLVVSVGYVKSNLPSTRAKALTVWLGSEAAATRSAA
jgi:hypothetical protein